jgi:hypothetical protein
MGPISTKFDPEMEDKYGRNPIQTAKIFPAMREIAPKPAPSGPANAPADPLKKPTQPMLALFGSTVNGSTIGAPETKPKEAFAWEKTKGIE